MTAELSNKIKSIEVDFIETFSNGFQSDNQYLYQEDFGERLSLLLSSIHYHVNLLLREMNSRMKQKNFYYLADSSRKYLYFLLEILLIKKVGELNLVLNCSLLVKGRMLRFLNTLMISMINILL